MVEAAELGVVLEILGALDCFEVFKDVFLVDLVLEFGFCLEIEGW